MDPETDNEQGQPDYDQGMRSFLRTWGIVGALFSKDGLQKLISSLKSADSETRSLAALSLGVFGYEEAAGPLSEALNDKDPAVRRSAAEALASLGGERAVDAQIVMLNDVDHGVRSSAALALGKLGDKRASAALIKALGDESAFVRAAAAFELGTAGDEQAVEALVGALGDPEPDVRRNAAYALGRLGEPAVLPLVDLLRNADNDIRLWAASALAETGDRRAVQSLIRALTDEDIRVRLEAAQGLGDLGDARAIRSLIALLGDDNSDLSRTAASSLGKLGKAAVKPLIGALGSENSAVRLRAASALGELGDKRALRALELVRDNDLAIAPWGVRVSEVAARSIKRIQGEMSEPEKGPDGVTYEFELYADHYQFYLGDSTAEADTSADTFWTRQALADQLAVVPGLIGVGTASYDYVPVVVEIRNAPPADDFDGWDRVVEASLDVPSGRIAIEGCLSYRPDEPRITVQPGVYRVRVYGGALGVECDDHYKIVLWPQAYAAPRVLKAWSPTDANTGLPPA